MPLFLPNSSATGARRKERWFPAAPGATINNAELEVINAREVSREVKISTNGGHTVTLNAPHLVLTVRPGPTMLSAIRGGGSAFNPLPANEDDTTFEVSYPAVDDSQLPADATDGQRTRFRIALETVHDWINVLTNNPLSRPLNGEEDEALAQAIYAEFQSGATKVILSRISSTAGKPNANGKIYYNEDVRPLALVNG